MNEFIANKLGEVLAFSLASGEVVERGYDALAKVMGEKRLQAASAMSDKYCEEIKQLTKRYRLKDLVEEKAKRTKAKLKTMRECYLNDVWDDATELLEWLGFFEGGAIVHWMVVIGTGKGSGHDELVELGGRALAFHKDMLEQVSQALQSVGTVRASAI